ncbi:MAG: ABC transporter permease [Chloroflexi bacterium]|nr:MAG: ABC transporter permease [Chloroflexota bacterium]
MVPIVLGASIVAFTIMHVAPGSPWNREGRQLNPELIAELNAEFGLDQPLPIQYLMWLAKLLQGDLGMSMSFGGDVGPIILGSLGPTLLICGLAFGIAVLLGVPLGLIAAMRHRTMVGRAATALSLVGMAAPAFAVAAFLQLLVPINPFTWCPFGCPPTLVPEPFSEAWFADLAQSWVLPVIAMAALPLAQIARHTKASVLEILHSDYVRTAHSKGLREDRIVRVHLLRNAAIPILTIGGTILALLVTGSIVVERVFGVDGLGNLYYQSIRARDYNTLMAITVVYALVVAFANALVDIAYGAVDPRIRDGIVMAEAVPGG